MTRVHVILILSAVATGWCSPGAAQDDPFPRYVGRRVCLECHAAHKNAGVCTLEAIPKHDVSYDALKKPEAEHIAALSGLGEEPRQSRICLFCHATAADEGPRWTADTFDVADGVQCEACHDAGSFHVRVYELVGPDPKADHRGQLRRSHREDCKSCHIERPSHKAVLEDGFRRSAADRLYKTPVHLAVSPASDVLYVACERSDSVIVVDLAIRKVVAEIPVGRRPHDVAVSPDGGVVYVTNRMSDTLSVIDAASRKVTAEVRVGDDPHGVLLDAAGDLIYVLNTGQNSISVIDAVAHKEIKRLVAGVGPWSLALRPDGDALYVTNVRPDPVRLRQPHASEVTVVNARRGVVTARPVAADANMQMGIAFVPDPPVALYTLMRTKDLVPSTRLAQGWTITNGLGIVWPDGRVDQVLLDEPNNFFPDATDVAVSPNGRWALVTSGGGDQVAVIDIVGLLATVTGATDRERNEVLPNHLGTSSRFIVKRVAVGANPRGVLFAPDGRFAYVANALDDSITVLDAADFAVAGVIDLGGPDEITETRRGERLFRNAENAFGRQFSCSSCHPDGHVNGLSIDIEADGIGMHPVDNRTLQGIFDTPPFKWEGTNPSLERQCGPRLAVFFTRLDPFTPEELAALVRFMCTIERPPNRYRRPEGLTQAQRRGKAVFERTHANDGQPLAPEARCIICHNSAYKTARTVNDVGTTLWFDAPAEIQVDNLYDVKDLGELGTYYFVDTGVATKAFDVPHLNNVYESPPYLHNGVAPTLEEIWTRFNMIDRHGQTADLTRAQFNDLIAYLKAL